jgi:hypothetical protein
MLDGTGDLIIKDIDYMCANSEKAHKFGVYELFLSQLTGKRK